MKTTTNCTTSRLYTVDADILMDAILNSHSVEQLNSVIINQSNCSTFDIDVRWKSPFEKQQILNKLAKSGISAFISHGILSNDRKKLKVLRILSGNSSKSKSLITENNTELIIPSHMERKLKSCQKEIAKLEEKLSKKRVEPKATVIYKEKLKLLYSEYSSLVTIQTNIPIITGASYNRDSYPLNQKRTKTAEFSRKFALLSMLLISFSGIQATINADKVEQSMQVNAKLAVNQLEKSTVKTSHTKRTVLATTKDQKEIPQSQVLSNFYFLSEKELGVEVYGMSDAIFSGSWYREEYRLGENKNLVVSQHPLIMSDSMKASMWIYPDYPTSPTLYFCNPNTAIGYDTRLIPMMNDSTSLGVFTVVDGKLMFYYINGPISPRVTQIFQLDYPSPSTSGISVNKIKNFIFKIQNEQSNLEYYFDARPSHLYSRVKNQTKICNVASITGESPYSPKKTLRQLTSSRHYSKAKFHNKTKKYKTVKPQEPVKRIYQENYTYQVNRENTVELEKRTYQQESTYQTNSENAIESEKQIVIESTIK